jgi:hypothetical protein
VPTQETYTPALSEQELQESVMLARFRDFYLGIGQPRNRSRQENLLAWSSSPDTTRGCWMGLFHYFKRPGVGGRPEPRLSPLGLDTG